MTHPALIKAISARQHKINPRIANGFATERMQQIERFVHELFRISYPKFGCNFRLDGISMATPEEYFSELTRSRNNKKRHFEIVRSDYYMVKLHCSLDREPCHPINLLIPYSKGFNMFKIRGSNFMVRPVMADTAISVMRNSLFIQVSCAPLTFERTDYSVLENGEVRTNQIIYGKQLHAAHSTKSIDGKVRVIVAKLTMVHYALATHGMRKALKMFCADDVMYGRIDTSGLDREEWMVYESMFTVVNGRPHGHRQQDEFYEAHNFKFAVRKKHVTPLLESLVYTTFYILDLFPIEVSDASEDDFDSPAWWRILLGHIIHSTKLPLSNNIKKMDMHMDSILSYLDSISQHELDRNGIRVNDIIELFVWVCENFTDKIKEYNTGFDFDGKRLMVERYITSDLQKQINQLAWTVKNASASRNGITVKDLNSILSRYIRSDILMKITSRHGEVESVQCPSNNPIPKVTSLICPQVSTGSKGSHGEIDRNDPAFRLTTQLVLICSVRDLTKSVPTGHNKINMFVDVTEEGDIKIAPDLDPYIRRMNTLFG